MEQIDSLKPGDEVTFTIYGPEGNTLYKFTGNGFHSLGTAIKEIVEKSNLQSNPEDCVFEITNHTKDVTHRYRLNAHGNLKRIV